MITIANNCDIVGALCIALQITKLKIDSNPFAKGFRDSSKLGDIERYKFVSLLDF